MASTEHPAFPFNRLPVRQRQGISFYVDKSPADFRSDPYEQYDPMVLRQTAFHLLREWWPVDPWKDLVDWAEEFVLERPHSHALEVGCGVGGLIGTIARRRPELCCLGVDYSYQMVRQASRYWCQLETIDIDGRDRGFGQARLDGYQLRNLTFALADAASLPFHSVSMDSVFTSFLLDRVGEPGAVLDEIHRILHPDGRLVLVLPYNFQRSEHWDDLYPPDRWEKYLYKQGWNSENQRSFSIVEPLDRHGNAVHWRADGWVLSRRY